MSLWGVYSTHLCLREPNSWIMLFSVVSSVSVSHSSTGGNTHTHTHTLKEAETYIYTFTHSYTLSHTKCMENRLSSCQTAACFLFFFSLQLSEPYVPQISSVNSKCARQTDMQRCAQERVSILGQSHARARAHGDAHPSGCVCMCEHGSCKTQKSMQTRRLEKHRLP